MHPEPAGVGPEQSVDPLAALGPQQAAAQVGPGLLEGRGAPLEDVDDVVPEAGAGEHEGARSVAEDGCLERLLERPLAQEAQVTALGLAAGVLAVLLGQGSEARRVGLDLGQQRCGQGLVGDEDVRRVDLVVGGQGLLVGGPQLGLGDLHVGGQLVGDLVAQRHVGQRLPQVGGGDARLEGCRLELGQTHQLARDAVLRGVDVTTVDGDPLAGREVGDDQVLDQAPQYRPLEAGTVPSDGLGGRRVGEAAHDHPVQGGGGDALLADGGRRAGADRAGLATGQGQQR